MPVAVKLEIWPIANDAVAGVMAMLASVAGVGVPLLPPPPHAVSNIETRYSAL